MMDSETMRFLREEIRRQLNIILSGSAGANTVESETIDNLFPGMPSVESRPVSHPYGLASRAPKGTISVNARMGDHVGNRIVIGHRDKDRPSFIASGEVILYNEFGQKIYLKNGKVLLSSEAAAENFVLGQQLKAMLLQIFDWAKNHEHMVTAPGALTAPDPTNATTVSGIQSNFVDNSKILSTKIFGE